MRKTKKKYTEDLAGQMYRFFLGYDGRGIPSFNKFAISVGLTTEDIEKFRSHKRFDRAYRECLEIRKDYLIDRALDKRFDGGFTKFLLSLEEEASSETSDFLLHLEVTE